MLNWYDNDISSIDIPDAIHIACISSINESSSKAGNPMWVFTLTLKDIPTSLNVYQVVDGSFKNQFARNAIVRRLKEMALCFSVTPPANNPHDWIGHSGYISTVHKTMENGAVFIQVDKFYPPKIGKANYEASKNQRSFIDNDFTDERTGYIPRPDEGLTRNNNQGRSVNKNWNPINPEPFDPEIGF